MTEPQAPPYISFTDAAELIVRNGLAGSMTPRGLRYIAHIRSNQTSEDGRWPFGDGPGQEPYLKAGRTRMMRTALLLEHFQQHPPTGRGPDKGERKRTKAEE
jgi:hypothetical protein